VCAVEEEALNQICLNLFVAATADDEFISHAANS